MGCNCKKGDNVVENNKESKVKKQPLIIKGIILIIKTFLYIIGSTIGVIVVIPYTFYMLFKVIYLDGTIDISDTLLNIGRLGQKKEIEETDEDDEDYDDEEFEFENEDEIVLLDTK